MDTVYTVKADEGGRAASAEELASLIGNQAEAMNSLASAYEAAVTGADADSVICVCGSLYLVGNFKNMLLKRKLGVIDDCCCRKICQFRKICILAVVGDNSCYPAAAGSFFGNGGSHWLQWLYCCVFAAP